MIDKRILNELRKEQQNLTRIISDAERQLRYAPPGSLQIRKHGNGHQFYHRDNPKEKNGKYIPVAEHKKVISLIQKRYLTKIISAARKQQNILNAFLEKYEEEALEKVYEVEGTVRQSFIKPVILPDDQYINSWQSVEYRGKGFRDDAPAHYTQRHERVRSKSEMMIANALLRAKIPYRYECPLELGNHLVYPDFTTLRIRDRKQMYWEHLGIMGDPDYRNQAFQKIRLYETNGFFLGDDLILTMETNRMPLNLRIVEAIIQHYYL